MWTYQSFVLDDIIKSTNRWVFSHILRILVPQRVAIIIGWTSLCLLFVQVKDPHLQKHLAHFGIVMTQLEKTEKSMVELEIEMNQVTLAHHCPWALVAKWLVWRRHWMSRLFAVPTNQLSIVAGNSLHDWINSWLLGGMWVKMYKRFSCPQKIF